MNTLNTELRYRRLFETAQDGILILDFETGIIQEANPYLLEMLGYDASEIIGKQLWEIGAMVDKTSSIKAFSALKKDGYIKYCDLPLRTKIGSLISVEFVSNAYDVNGNRVIQCNIRDISDRKNAEGALIKYQQDYLKIMLDTVLALTKVVVSRDSYTYDHQVRVSHLCVAIAAEMNFSAHRTEGLRLAALIHDIGKIGIPFDILVKTSPLSEDEINILKKHAVSGFEIVKNIQFVWPIAQIIRQHHCRMDGSGYPDGLMGDSILVEARILAVADTVEAMCFSRPFRPARSRDLALAELDAGARTKFDPEVVSACKRVFLVNGYQFPAVAASQ